MPMCVAHYSSLLPSESVANRMSFYITRRKGSQRARQYSVSTVVHRKTEYSDCRVPKAFTLAQTTRLHEALLKRITSILSDLQSKERGVRRFPT